MGELSRACCYRAGGEVGCLWLRAVLVWVRFGHSLGILGAVGWFWGVCSFSVRRLVPAGRPLCLPVDEHCLLTLEQLGLGLYTRQKRCCCCFSGNFNKKVTRCAAPQSALSRGGGGAGTPPQGPRPAPPSQHPPPAQARRPALRATSRRRAGYKRRERIRRRPFGGRPRRRQHGAGEHRGGAAGRGVLGEVGTDLLFIYWF